MFVCANVAHARVEQLDQIQSTIDSYVDKNSSRVKGLSVVVSSEKDIVAEGSYGAASLEFSGAEPVFEWGEVSELLVWISLMQLEEEGKLSLDKDIRMYLPQDFLLPLYGDKPLTLNDIMNHQSGFDDVVLNTTLSPGQKVPSLEEILTQTRATASHNPGSVVARSPYAVTLAAYVVSRVSGVDYDEYVQEHIFKPLRMYSTSIKPFTLSPSEEELQKAQQLDPTHPQFSQPYGYWFYPAQGVRGSAQDLLRLARGVLNFGSEPIFQKDETYQKLFVPTAYYLQGAPRIAHGFFTMPSDENLWYISGTTRSMSAVIEVSPHNNMAVVVCSMKPHDDSFIYQIPELIFGRKSSIESGVVEDASLYWGVYQLSRSTLHGPTMLTSFFQRKFLFGTSDGTMWINRWKLHQVQPGEYHDDGAPQAKSLIYIGHALDHTSVVSYPNQDAYRIPTMQFVFEALLLIGWVLACIASVISLIYAASVRVKSVKWGSSRRVGKRSVILACTHLVATAIVGVCAYRIMNDTAYVNLKLPIMLETGYAVCGAVFAYLMVRKTSIREHGKRYCLNAWTLTASFIIIVMNLLYWEIIF